MQGIDLHQAQSWTFIHVLCFDMRQALSCVKDDMRPSLAYELTAVAEAVARAIQVICKQAQSITIRLLLLLETASLGNS